MSPCLDYYDQCCNAYGTSDISLRFFFLIYTQKFELLNHLAVLFLIFEEALHCSPERFPLFTSSPVHRGSLSPHPRQHLPLVILIVARHEFEQTPRDGEGQGSLACCSPWVAESDMTEGLNNDKNSNNVKRYLNVVSICIPLMFSDGKHLFMCLWT